MNQIKGAICLLFWCATSFHFQQHSEGITPPHPLCRGLMKMCVVTETEGVQGPNVCWTGAGQTVVLIVLGPSLFTYVDPSEAMNMQQLPVVTGDTERQDSNSSK